MAIRIHDDGSVTDGFGARATCAIRWRPTLPPDAPPYLEQCWINLDGKEEWRMVETYQPIGAKVQP